MTDADDRTDYLEQTVRTLWPRLGHEQGAVARVVLPKRSAPRLLVPSRPRRAAASAVLRYTARQGLPEQARGAVLAGFALTGMTTALRAISNDSPSDDDESIDNRLGDVLGHEVTTALSISKARTNRKPVLQIFDADGHTVAFAKIAMSPTTSELVTREADALDRLNQARLTTFRIPRLLHSGTWRGYSMLVCSALPCRGRRNPQSELLDRAMRELATSGLAHGSMDTFVTSLRTRVGRGREDAVPAADSGVRAAWTAALEQVTASPSAVGLRMGCWHGDWTRWNCLQRRGQLFVWDWERLAAPVPVGFDQLHYRFMRKAFETGIAAAARELVADARQTLSGWGLDPEQARTTARCYLLDLSARYLADGASGTVVAPIEDWALPAVRAGVDR